jgi:stage III sporulation protein AC
MEMLDVGLIFKIGAVGILLMILDKVLKSSGKEEIAAFTNMAGIIIILMMIINLISKLFSTMRTMLQL